jgi:1-acyl-sn-glycerol-3-phosphate acyltransferase
MTDAPPQPGTEIDAWVEADPHRLQHAFRVFTGWIWRFAYRHRALGSEHVPRDGAVIFVPNHSSYLDPFLQVYGQPRDVRFMAKSTLFDVPVLKHIMRIGGAFPVRRGRSDSGAIDLARTILQSGQVLVIYPEGTRFRHDLPLGPAKSGAARLALESGAAVVPVASWGCKDRKLYGLRRFERRRVTVAYGEPMTFDLEPTRENAAIARDQIWAEVQRLYVKAREADAAR